jgi:hypothetical protein
MKLTMNFIMNSLGGFMYNNKYIKFTTIYGGGKKRLLNVTLFISNEYICIKMQLADNYSKDL